MLAVRAKNLEFFFIEHFNENHFILLVRHIHAHTRYDEPPIFFVLHHFNDNNLRVRRLTCRAISASAELIA